ncbi:MAG TPA: Uma2 family endonuclease [Candidatus Elarobacter sp.]|nr:Uma2 family endonuclease [Candidatus Elarobacter sp.]
MEQRDIRIRPITVAQYHRMLDVGIVYEREPVELLDGQLIAMPPEGPLHRSAVMALNELLVQRFAGRAMVCPGNPLELDDTSEPQPDLTLVHRHDDWYKSAHPRSPEVFLVIEVSLSTLAYDRGRKLRAYARSGIAELWIVNLVHRQVEVYTEPHELGYAGKLVLDRGGTIAPRAFPNDAIPVASFLP